MAGNSFGKIFKLSTFGESHGPAIGGIIDGCPSGLLLNQELIRYEMKRRRPGQSALSTPRIEADDYEILSGVYEGKTLGTPIGFIIRNQDYRPSDYEALKDVYRPSHADFTYQEKYGFRDHRGGGRSSARETASWVFAGSVARQLLPLTEIMAFVSAVGPVTFSGSYEEGDRNKIDSSPVRCPDEGSSAKMIAFIESLKKSGDSTGGVITCVIRNCPAGLGEPVFRKLQSKLAAACLSINAAHGFEYGSGFAGASGKGSEFNDAFRVSDGKVITATNHSGGIQGGISNGMDVYFRVAFKPVSTISMEQQTVNSSGENVILKASGRHDPCVVPRAVPVVEALAALTLADLMLEHRCSRL